MSIQNTCISIGFLCIICVCVWLHTTTRLLVWNLGSVCAHTYAMSMYQRTWGRGCLCAHTYGVSMYYDTRFIGYIGFAMISLGFIELHFVPSVFNEMQRNKWWWRLCLGRYQWSRRLCRGVGGDADGLTQVPMARILAMSGLAATALWGGRSATLLLSSSCNDDDHGQNIAKFQFFPQP